MIISSKLNDDRWIWVKVPKTGTRAYSQLFYPKEKSELHFHFTFHELYEHHQRKHPGFTVVRHPTTRFISALKHMASLNLGGVPYDNMKHLVEFIYDHFDKNCVPKQNKTLEEIFHIDYTKYHESFFKTQTYWGYHPKVIWFRYENLQPFNTWIETTLGYNTSTLTSIGKIPHNPLKHLDFSDVQFQRIVKHLFHDDFHVFNYQEDV